MALYKEIVTKAVVGKGKKSFKDKYTIKPDDVPTTVLGCWVINHQFKGYKSGDKIGVDGSFDVNVWYSYDNNSKTNVVSKNITYNDLFNVKIKEDAKDSDTEIIVRSLNQPSCTDVKIEDGSINFEINKELGVEVVGESKIKIAIEEDEEPWDDITDINDETLDEIDKVDENYI